MGKARTLNAFGWKIQPERAVPESCGKTCRRGDKVRDEWV
jgi:hypothetical protein